MHLLNPWLLALISMLIFLAFAVLMFGVYASIVGWRYGWPARSPLDAVDDAIADDDEVIEPISLDK